MTHRDQLRLAIEMQNGLVDRFVEARMRVIDCFRGVRTDNSLLAAWLSYGEPTSPQTGWKFLDDNDYPAATAAEIRRAWHTAAKIANAESPITVENFLSKLSAPVSDS